MKPLFCALALSLMLPPAMAQDVATPPVAEDIGIMEERPAIPTLTDDGLSITPLDVPVDHVGEMLGIQMWQFKVEPPKNMALNTMLAYRLELRRLGQKPIKMKSGGFGFAVYETLRTLEFTFGIMPQGDDIIETAEALRLYTATHIWNAKSRVGDQSSGGNYDNPLKDLKLFGAMGGGGRANVAPDGTATLIEFKTEGHADYDTQLVLVLTAENH